MIKIMIVDDHAIVRQGLRLMLEAQPHIEVLAECKDAETALLMVNKQLPDLVLIDLIMPGIGGIEGIRQLKNRHPTIKILVLTSSLEDQLVKEALQAGAQGYILKASRPSELLHAIDQVIEGYTAIDSVAGQVLIRQMQTPDALLNLTERERDVFDAMARGLSNPDIAQKLVISEGTVRTHVVSIYDKLQLRDRTQITIYALKRGLIRLDELP